MVEGRRAPELSVTDGFLAKKSLRLVMYEVESKLNNQQGDNVTIASLLLEYGDILARDLAHRGETRSYRLIARSFVTEAVSGCIT
jgi:hypothetical protein